MTSKIIPISGRVRLVLDYADAATPAMVYSNTRTQEYSASYDCATDTGELVNGRGYVLELTQDELAELERHRDEAEEAFAAARPDGWC